jgi:hypothetical protein
LPGIKRELPVIEEFFSFILIKSFKSLILFVYGDSFEKL